MEIIVSYGPKRFRRNDSRRRKLAPNSGMFGSPILGDDLEVRLELRDDPQRVVGILRLLLDLETVSK